MDNSKSRALKSGTAEHRCSIRNGHLKNPVAVCFKEAQHPVSSLKYSKGTEHIKVPRRGGDINKLLLQRESFHIYLTIANFDTQWPKSGL